MVKNDFSVFLLFQHRHLHSFIQSVCVCVYKCTPLSFLSNIYLLIYSGLYHVPFFFSTYAKAVIQSPAHICVPSPSFSCSLKMQYL